MDHVNIKKFNGSQSNMEIISGARSVYLCKISICLLVILGYCGTPFKSIASDNHFVINQSKKSTNFNSRIRQIVIHNTDASINRSFYELLGEDNQRDVSSHYLINNGKSDKYPDIIYQLVPDSKRSWHAGISSWYHDEDLNNSSIGIEIVNKNGNSFPYSKEQIKAVIFLCKQLKEKYNIKDVNIVGHSDIAPARKIDPGKLFPWQTLSQNGVGAWYDKSDIKRLAHEIIHLPHKDKIKQDLIKYGYGLDMNTKDNELFVSVVSAFQRHFRQKKVNGAMDLETYIILRALLEKYR